MTSPLKPLGGFHIQPPGSLGPENYSNGLDHLNNMVIMPIHLYGKNLLKSSQEPINRGWLGGMMVLDSFRV